MIVTYTQKAKKGFIFEAKKQLFHRPMLKTEPPIHHPLLKKGEKKLKPSLLRTALMGGKEKLLTINNNWFLFLYFSFLHSLHYQPLGGDAL